MWQLWQRLASADPVAVEPPDEHDRSAAKVEVARLPHVQRAHAVACVPTEVQTLQLGAHQACNHSHVLSCACDCRHLPSVICHLSDSARRATALPEGRLVRVCSEAS
jgi:hypothetical protein